MINFPGAAGGRDPNSQPPEQAATTSAAGTVSTAEPAARRTDLRDSVGHSATGRGQPVRIAAGVRHALQPGETRPDRLGMRGEPG